MQTSTLKSFILRYKLYHIPFWLVYHLVWLTINIGGLSKVADYLYFSDSSVKFYFYLVFQTLGVYFNLYYLIPKFLYVGKYFTYTFLVMATTLCCTAFITMGYYVAAYLSDLTFLEMFGVGFDQYPKVFLIWALPSSTAVMTLGMSVKLAKNWLEAEKRKNKLEKENLETELRYLKSQINPHFLFNTINSIFALIPKNPDLASESLADFSDMLRFQLYECNDATIALEKELKFLKNFIDLEKLRIDEEHTELQFTISGDSTQGNTIAPFILIPFIENAFKFVSKGKKQKNFIRMLVETSPKGIKLKIENSVNRVNGFVKESTSSSGIGLKNVQRRLNLIYKDKHHLKLESLENKFSVILTIAW